MTTQTESRPILNHSTIGPIQGISRIPNVTQFLGVQYAKLRDRFSRGQLIENYPKASQPLNATEHGQIAVSLPNACDAEHGLIQHSLPHPEYEQSNTECLRLNIAVPSNPARKDLPVMVFFHGGGFFTGSSSWPHYDLARFVALSISAASPIIALAVNYRLGVPGFLTSKSMREAGYKPNNGLDDQRLALRWVKRHIAGFGGDPEKVTWLGESAGAAAGCMHLESGEPLFQQLIAMGGTSLIKPIPLEVADGAFQMVMARLGVDDLSPDDQIKALLKVPVEDLAIKFVGIPTMPVLDSDIIPAMTSYTALFDPSSASELFPGMKWCRRILVGDCQFDASVFMAMGLAGRTEPLPKLLERSLSSKLGLDATPKVSELLKAYSVDTSASENTAETMIPVLQFMTDIGFSDPALAFAKAWSQSQIPDTKAFLYHFNSPNPWDGPWKGHATHVFDIACLFQNYNEYLAPGQRACGERFARDFIKFAYGSNPWSRFESFSPAAMVYYARVDGERDESVFAPYGESNLTGRRHILEKVIGEDMFDDMLDVMSMLLRGSH